MIGFELIMFVPEVRSVELSELVGDRNEIDDYVIIVGQVR